MPERCYTCSQLPARHLNPACLSCCSLRLAAAIRCCFSQVALPFTKSLLQVATAFWPERSSSSRVQWLRTGASHLLRSQDYFSVSRLPGALTSDSRHASQQSSSESSRSGGGALAEPKHPRRQ